MDLDVKSLSNLIYETLTLTKRLANAKQNHLNPD